MAKICSVIRSARDVKVNGSNEAAGSSSTTTSGSGGGGKVKGPKLPSGLVSLIEALCEL